MRTYTTKEQREEMWQLFQEGLTVAEIAHRYGVSWSTAYGYTKVRERGYRSLQEFNRARLRERGFPSQRAYDNFLAQRMGYASHYDYRDCKMREKHNMSLSEYQRRIASTHQKRMKYQEISSLIARTLRDMNKTQRWLAEQMGVSEQTVVSLVHGRTLPNVVHRKSLCDALHIDESTLEHIIHDRTT